MRVVTPPEIGERQGYAAALADLWRGLQPTLSNLDSLAATPAEELLDRGGELLPRLQYELHTAGELALGIVAPAGTEGEHADLAAALAAARDATAELLEAVESGSLEAVAALTYPWRGALFEVRLARLRLGAAARTAAFFGRRGRRRAARVPHRRAIAGLLGLLAFAAIFGSGAVGVAPLFLAGVVLGITAAIVLRA